MPKYLIAYRKTEESGQKPDWAVFTTDSELSMMRAAAEGAASAAKTAGSRRPLVLAVTVLTSLDRAALSRELSVSSSVEGHVLHLCQLARTAGLDGCVAAAHEIRAIRNLLGPS